VCFESAVLGHFRWLEGFGYEVVRSCSTLVRYEGPSSYVSVYHGRRSGEIGVEVTPAARETTYSMSELIRLINSQSANEYRNPVALTPEVIERQVGRQSERFKMFGQRVVRNDTAVWGALDAQRARWAAEQRRLQTLSRVLPEADHAFQDGKYERVVELLSDVEPWLSDVQRRKLSYARRRLQDT
jgi:hypothetical protein